MTSPINDEHERRQRRIKCVFTRECDKRGLIITQYGELDIGDEIASMKYFHIKFKPDVANTAGNFYNIAFEAIEATRLYLGLSEPHSVEIIR